MKKIIISNGFNKFHLANAAAEVHKHGLLARLITGAYPTARLQRLLSLPGLSGNPKVARFRDREAGLPGRMVRGLWLSEAAQKLAVGISRVGPTRLIGQRLDAWSYRAYGWLACNSIRRFAGDIQIYHYRAGFGHSSVRLAKSRGIFALCDHSIAHPGVLSCLVETGGKLPAPTTEGSVTPLWRDILADIDQADAVLVNSEFVKQTFLHQGWDASRIHVITLGIDDEFFEHILSRPPIDRTQSIRLLFAGSLEQRKGAHVLLDALRNLCDVPWHLDIVGPVSAVIARDYADVLQDHRTTVVGIVRRRDLARYMAGAEVFVFPSLAEGSARVVFEALASGCYVITTANSGSIVEDGVHGAIVPPGDSSALEAAIRSAIANRDSLAAVGTRNAELIRHHYRQRDYGEALVDLYHRLLTERGEPGMTAVASKPAP